MADICVFAPGISLHQFECRKIIGRKIGEADERLGSLTTQKQRKKLIFLRIRTHRGSWYRQKMMVAARATAEMRRLGNGRSGGDAATVLQAPEHDLDEAAALVVSDRFEPRFPAWDARFNALAYKASLNQSAS
jgi:hypothetical protein